MSGDVAVVYGGADALVLQSELSVTQVEGCSCAGEADLLAGDEAFVALTYAVPHQLDVHRIDRDEARSRIDVTSRF